MKIAVLTSLIGSLEHLHDPKVKFKGVDYYAFVDKVNLDCTTWKQIEYHSFTLDEKYTNRRNAKIYKILPELFIPNYDYYIWHDVSHELIVDPVEILSNEKNKNAAYLVFRHTTRNCIYNEANIIKKLGYDNKKLVNEQVNYYKKNGYPSGNGLYELSAFIKNSKKSMLTSLIWWENICKFSSRDQISFPYAVWKSKVDIVILEGFSNGINANGEIGNNKYIPQVRKHISSGENSNFAKRVRRILGKLI